MPDRTIAIADAEARLAAQGKLGAILLPNKGRCPLGAPGQRLGLKETWMPETEQGCPTGGCLYKATDAPEPDGDRPLIWRSPITMPARFIRHRPTVADVRAVQVCRMQPEDAIALGFSTKLREHDAVCALREQVAEHYHITPSTWVWFARLEGEAVNA